MSGDIRLTVLHLATGHVLSAVTTSASVGPDVAALTGGSHLAVAADDDPSVIVEVPADELTAVTLEAPAAVLDGPRSYAVTDVGGPAVVLVPSTGAVTVTVSGTQVTVENGPNSAEFVAVLMTPAGPTVARGALDADAANTDTTIDSPSGAVAAALVAPKGAPCSVETA
jgi:hypothetical protein